MLSTIHEDDEEDVALHSAPLDVRVLDAVRAVRSDECGRRTVRPALLAAELGLSVEEATRELCGLLSAVGGGDDGASFAFERVEVPSAEGGGDGGSGAAAAAAAGATTMVFAFPDDFDERARRHRRRSDRKQRLRALAAGLVKAIKVFTAFGLIISLAVLIIAGICLLVAAVVALARGGHGNGGGHRNHPLMHRLRYLFFQLRQILWLYAICGSAVDGNQDPFMREVAGDMAFMMSLCCGNPMHPFFWFRVGGMRRRWARVRRTRGWGSDGGGSVDGIAMMRRGTWGDDGDNTSRRNNYYGSSDQERGLLSIAVEFLFGPSSGDDAGDNNSNLPLSSKELEKWKFRAAVIMTLSSESLGNGISLRELLPYVDNPPASAEDPSAIRDTLRIVTYFNGKPAADNGDQSSSSGIDARFCFPEIVAEMDCQKLLSLANLGSSDFAPPMRYHSEGRTIHSILYKEEDEFRSFGSSENASASLPDYLYERPVVLTELSRQQFGQCVMLGLLNLLGIIWVRNAMMPGGLLELRIAAKSQRSGRGSGSLITLASILVLKLLNVLRFYAGFFFVLPICRLAIVLFRNFLADRRNKRRSNFVTNQ